MWLFSCQQRGRKRFEGGAGQQWPAQSHLPLRAWLEQEVRWGEVCAFGFCASGDLPFSGWSIGTLGSRAAAHLLPLAIIGPHPTPNSLQGFFNRWSVKGKKLAS